MKPLLLAAFLPFALLCGQPTLAPPDPNEAPAIVERPVVSVMRWSPAVDSGFCGENSQNGCQTSDLITGRSTTALAPIDAAIVSGRRALAMSVLAMVAEPDVAPAPIDVTGPDQRQPVAIRQAVFFPVKNVPKDAPFDIFMVPDDGGEFFDLYDRTGNPVGVFSPGREGRFTCVVVCVAEGKIQRDQHTITVGTSPIPPPGPGPGPAPVIPDGKLRFTRLAYDESMKIPDRSKAAALADNFDGVASAAAAGTIKTVEAANAELVTRNRAVLGDAGRATWLAFFTKWSDAADTALKDGTLKASIEDYGAIYRATAEGLRLAKTAGGFNGR